MSDKALVCRCEDVTLEECRKALERGHRDLESLKRFTGLATGWCQGKLCVSLASRLLVEHGEPPPELPVTPRPPFHPVPLAQLAGLEAPPTDGAPAPGVRR